MMAIKKVNLKPVGEAIEKAQADLKELAKLAPRKRSLELKAKVEALAIVHVQVKILCQNYKTTRPYGYCGLSQKGYKVRPPTYGISIEDDS
jgi:hypothetical protein